MMSLMRTYFISLSKLLFLPFRCLKPEYVDKVTLVIGIQCLREFVKTTELRRTVTICKSTEDGHVALCGTITDKCKVFGSRCDYR